MRVLLLLFTLLLPTALHAHLAVLLDGDLLITEEGDANLTLSASLEALARLAGYDGPPLRTRRDLAAMLPALKRRLAAGLVLMVDGEELGPAWTGTLEEAQGKSGAPDDPLPGHVITLAMWKLPRRDSTAQLKLRLCPGETVMISAIIRVRRHGEVHELVATSEATAPLEEMERIGSSEIAAPLSMPPATVVRPERDESLWMTLRSAVKVGFRHIVPHGLDHILFVLGLYVAARRMGSLAWQITAFTVAHSLTLCLAMLDVVGGGETYARMVEIAIAASIAWVAIENLWMKKEPGKRRILLVAVFGLIHGLGFAGALGDVEWPPGRFVPALISANIGIELGQLCVVGAAALLSAWWWKRDWYRRAIVIPVSAGIGLCGLWWVVERAF